MNPFWRGRDLELVHLGSVQQQLAGAQRIVVHGIAVGEGADVRVQQETLAILEQAVGVFEVGFAFADGLDLGAAQGDPGLEFVEQGIVVAGGPVVGGVALAGGDRVAVLGPGGWLGLRGDGRIGERSGHRRCCGESETGEAAGARGGRDHGERSV